MTAQYQEAKENEARQWAQYEAVAGRCIEMAERLWDGRLAAAIEAQRKLAETMRDRPMTGDRDENGNLVWSGSIPVPLFTPRDRMQFLKEFTTTLLIGTDKRGLSVLPEEERHEPAVVPFGPNKGKKLADLSTEALQGAVDWALSKNVFAAFRADAEAELAARASAAADRSAAIQNQPLNERPLALADAD